MTKQKYAQKEHSHDGTIEWRVIIGVILFVVVVLVFMNFYNINNLRAKHQDVKGDDCWEEEVCYNETRTNWFDFIELYY